MKRTLICLTLCLAIVACNKDEEPTPENKSTSSSLYDPKWIPNWVPGDTLLGLDQDSTGQYVGVDTMFTAKFGDTTCIYYHGVKYYLWTSTYYSTIADKIDTFEDNQRLYANCYIGSVAFDTANGILDHGVGTTVWPSKSLKPDGTWAHREQTIMVHSYLNFADVLLNQYRSMTEY